MTTQTRARLVPSLTRVTDEAERKRLWSTVLALWGLPPTIRHFPGCNPVPVDRDTVRLLVDKQYVVAQKTDGVRMLLLLTVRSGGDPVAVMIDRTLAMFEVLVWANRPFFEEGSLFDGELAWCEPEGKSMAYLVFDVVSTTGKRHADRPFGERLQVIHHCVAEGSADAAETERLVGEENKCVCMQKRPFAVGFAPKPFVPLTQLRSVCDASKVGVPHKSDGLLFTRVDAKMDLGTSTAILKWKAEHTVDVLVSRRPAGHTLRAECNADADASLVPMERIGHGGPVTVVENAVLREARLPRVVECVLRRRDAGGIELTPVRIRYDKDTPNAKKTILFTVRGAAKHLGMEDVLRAVAGEGVARLNGGGGRRGGA